MAKLPRGIPGAAFLLPHTRRSGAVFAERRLSTANFVQDTFPAIRGSTRSQRWSRLLLGKCLEPARMIQLVRWRLAARPLQVVIHPGHQAQ